MLYKHSTLEVEQLKEIIKPPQITVSFVPMISACKVWTTNVASYRRHCFVQESHSWGTYVTCIRKIVFLQNLGE